MISDAPYPDSEDASPVLEVSDLTKHYEDAPAVQELSFEVAPGEVLGLLGPNGAGKTTTLRTIAGILPVESGSIRVAGHDITKAERAAKQRLAWVPDDPQPFDAMTIFEHLEFIARLYRVDTWESEAERLLERFELTEKREALGGELSRGMRQKLAFCCAFLPRPRLLLLDEPLSGLDPRGIRSAKAAIAEIAREGVAVVLSSHQLDLVQELASRLLVLERGQPVFDGTLDEARVAITGGADAERLEDLFFALTEGQPAGSDSAPGSTPVDAPGSKTASPLADDPLADDPFADGPKQP